MCGVGRGAVKTEEINLVKGDKTSSAGRPFLSTVVLTKLISLYCLFSTAHHAKWILKTGYVNLLCKATVTDLESHTTGAQWVCLEA